MQYCKFSIDVPFSSGEQVATTFKVLAIPGGKRVIYHDDKLTAAPSKGKGMTKSSSQIPARVPKVRVTMLAPVVADPNSTAAALNPVIALSDSYHSPSVSVLPHPSSNQAKAPMVERSVLLAATTLPVSQPLTSSVKVRASSSVEPPAQPPPKPDATDLKFDQQNSSISESFVFLCTGST